MKEGFAPAWKGCEARRGEQKALRDQALAGPARPVTNGFAPKNYRRVGSTLSWSS